MALLSMPSKSSLALLGGLMWMGGSAAVQNSAESYLTVEKSVNDLGSFVEKERPLSPAGTGGKFAVSIPAVSIPAVALVVSFPENAVTKQEILAHAEAVRKEGNSEYYNVYQRVANSPGDPEDWLSVEYYPTPEKYAAHKSFPAYQAWSARKLTQVFRMQYGGSQPSGVLGTVSLGSKDTKERYLDAGLETHCPAGAEDALKLAQEVGKLVSLNDGGAFSQNVSFGPKGFSWYRGVEDPTKIWIHEPLHNTNGKEHAGYKAFKEWYFQSSCSGFMARLSAVDNKLVPEESYVGGVTVRTKYAASLIPALKDLRAAAKPFTVYYKFLTEQGLEVQEEELDTHEGWVIVDETYYSWHAQQAWTNGPAINAFRTKHGVLGADKEVSLVPSK